MRHFSLLIVALLVGAQGCGLKGPLYLPEPAKEAPASEEDEKEKKKTDQPAAPAQSQEQQ
jgi:predicted small lipoprotein YifL